MKNIETEKSIGIEITVKETHYDAVSYSWSVWVWKAYQRLWKWVYNKIQLPHGTNIKSSCRRSNITGQNYIRIECIKELY